MKRGNAIILTVWTFVFTLQCYSQKVESNIGGELLFTQLDPSTSNIYFNNQLHQTNEDNIFVYKGFYKGGGVAIGDINNDGLLDIYFTCLLYTSDAADE